MSRRLALSLLLSLLLLDSSCHDSGLGWLYVHKPLVIGIFWVKTRRSRSMMVSNCICHVHQWKCLLLPNCICIVFQATFVILDCIEVDIKHRLVEEWWNLAAQRTEVLTIIRFTSRFLPRRYVLSRIGLASEHHNRDWMFICRFLLHRSYCCSGWLSGNRGLL